MKLWRLAALMIGGGALGFLAFGQIGGMVGLGIGALVHGVVR